MDILPEALIDFFSEIYLVFISLTKTYYSVKIKTLLLSVILPYNVLPTCNDCSALQGPYLCWKHIIYETETYTAMCTDAYILQVAKEKLKELMIFFVDLTVEIRL